MYFLLCHRTSEKQVQEISTKEISTDPFLNMSNEDVIVQRSEAESVVASWLGESSSDESDVEEVQISRPQR